MKARLDAFAAANFDWTSHLQSVWREPAFDVEDLHRPIADELVDYFVRSTREPGLSPLGRVLVGPAGAGKTHLIGRLRQRAWQNGGWFVLVDTVGITDFWQTVALGFVASLQQPMLDGRPQYEAVSSEMLRCFVRDANARTAFLNWYGPERTRRETIDHFLSLLRHIDAAGAFRYGDIVRAVLLLGAQDWGPANLAYGWLQGLDTDAQERQRLGFLGPPPEPVHIVRGLSWLMGLGGPTLIAVDQIDAIVSASNLRSGAAAEPQDPAESRARSIIETLVGGLMDLRDVTSRSVTLVSCLEATWQVMVERSVRSATQRFRSPTPLEGVGAADLVEALVTARLGPAYASHAVTPPYPSWPFHRKAIESAVGLLPRPILMRCEEHRRRCLAAGDVLECLSFGQATNAPTEGSQDDLDRQYREEQAKADIAAFRLEESEEAPFRALLGEMLSLYVRQVAVPEGVDIEVHADPDERRPALHGRLTFVERGAGDREWHYCFRALGLSNATAFQARLRAAMTASGIDRALPFRRLFVLRREPPPGGTKSQTAQLVGEFESRGGKFIALGDGDLRIFVALRRLRERHADTFDAWLRSRQPLCETALFQAAGLCALAFSNAAPDVSPQPACPPEAPPADDAAKPSNEAGPEVTSGEPGLDVRDPPPRSVRGGPPQAVEGPAAAVKPQTEAAPPPETAAALAPSTVLRMVPLPRDAGDDLPGAPIRFPHALECVDASLALAAQGRPVAIFAGSGSGRTMLLKRLIEEAALAGVPALVVDTGGELAQLRHGWPAPPPQWSESDAAKAEAFRERVEVELVSSSASPAMPVLPDFSLFDTAEAREEAIEATCLALRPHLRIRSSAPEQGVLADALRFLALRRAGSLDELIGLLEELPVGISQIGHAPAFAAQMAEHLRTALKDGGAAETPAFDPGFFVARDVAKTKISILALSGLPSEEARRRSVDQLQRALLAWVEQRRTRRPLLFVLDDAQVFAPAQADPPSRQSTVALAQVAGSHGLGMIVATASPRSLDAEVAARCATRFYGRMHAPALIQATNDLLAQAGLAHADVAKLSAGEFFVLGPGTDRPAKIQAPPCLSWHRRHATDLPARPRPGAGDVMPVRRALSVVTEDTEAR
jgi:hypothetical protein